ncbi:uncharacterized protein LOC142363717 [Opisthocomus hoazin]|uniref:uncharacterized protein LOC142363717 n=1 Tax=Opisthocomus hoazin TaxID=30419 RepID=UPI003F53836A
MASAAAVPGTAPDSWKPHRVTAPDGQPSPLTNYGSQFVQGKRFPFGRDRSGTADGSGSGPPLPSSLPKPAAPASHRTPPEHVRGCRAPSTRLRRSEALSQDGPPCRGSSPLDRFIRARQLSDPEPSSGTPKLHLRVISAAHADPERYTCYVKLAPAGTPATGSRDGAGATRPTGTPTARAALRCATGGRSLLGAFAPRASERPHRPQSRSRLHAVLCTGQERGPLHSWSKNSGNKVIATYSSLHFCLLRQTN